MENVIGNPVEGENFFGRGNEVTAIWSRLKTDNILLLAPRRVGKTSLMLRLRDEAKAAGYEVLYASVAGAQTEVAFARTMLAAIAKHAAKKTIAEKLKTSRVGGWLRRVKKIGIFSVVELELNDEAKDHWAAIGEEIVAALTSSGARWLLLVDEVPIFILALLRADQSGVRARDFLNWFRTMRQDAGNVSRVRWLLAGSIGLDTVTRRMNFGDTINDLFLYNDFGPFDDETAHAFLRKLAWSSGSTLSDEVIARVCERMQWLLPFHLQLWFNEVPRGVVVTAEVADCAYERLLLPAKKSYFDFWRQRLHEELGRPDDARAIRILNVVAGATQDEGVSRQTLSAVFSMDIADIDERDRQLNYLVDVLTGDGYISARGDRHYFRSALLHEFWRRYVV